jgi:hypothetical protein
MISSGVFTFFEEIINSISQNSNGAGSKYSKLLWLLVKKFSWMYVTELGTKTSQIVGSLGV